MDNNTDERLRDLFTEASGGSSKGSLYDGSIGEATAHADTESSTSAQTSSFNPSLNSGAGQDYHGTSGTAKSSGSSSGSSSGVGSLLESVFGGALGAIPLVGSLFGLFGGKSTQQQTFEKYEMPSSISFEAAETRSGLTNADYGQMGMPRVSGSQNVDAPQAAATGGGAAVGVSSGSIGSATPSAGAATSVSAGAASGGAASANSNSSAVGANAGGSAGTPQIHVNVQAMDAQSFMNYSGDIAKAVREAMLNLSSLNDVVADL
jgi:hypothetical protein